jgi:hypothetical protein
MDAPRGHKRQWPFAEDLPLDFSEDNQTSANIQDSQPEASSTELLKDTYVCLGSVRRKTKQLIEN